MSSLQRPASADATCGSESQFARGVCRARYGLGCQVVLGAISVVLCLLAGPVACQPSNANATPPPQTSPKPAVAANRAPSPKRPPDVETRTVQQPDKPDYPVLEFEARANPFAPPKPEQPVRSADGQTAHTFDVQLTGLMTASNGMFAALIVDGRHEVVRAGASFRFGTDGGELKIVEIRPSEIVIEQNGRQRIVPLPRP